MGFLMVRTALKKINKWIFHKERKGDYMTVYVLTVDNEVVGVYDEYTKAYDIGCSKYDGDFDIDEFEVE